MKRESRVEKSIKSAKVNMLCYFASLLTAFFTRRIFIDYLGLEFMGLNGTVGSVLGFLNLAELGIGTAISCLLFKPVFDGDETKINELISVMGYLYRWIGIFIYGAAIIVSFFLPLIFSDTSFSMGVIYASFYLYLSGSMLGYFFNYKMILLSADQRNYVITGYFQLTTTLKLFIQMGCAILWPNFYLFLILEFGSALVNTAIIQWKLKKTYPWLKSELKEGRKLLKKYPEVTTKIKQVVVHKLGLFVKGQSQPLLIYAFASLSSVALYANYTIITGRVQNLFNGILDSAGGSVGNLVAEGDKKKIVTIFSQLFTSRLFVVGNLAFCFLYLLTPFVNVWLGPECIVSPSVVGIVVIMYLLNVMRGPTDYFINAYGLFSDVWAPIAESAISISVAILCGMRWGLPGVLMGDLTASVVIIYAWKTYFLFTRGFKVSPWHYWKLWLKAMWPMLLAAICAYFTTESLMSLISVTNVWLDFFIKASIFTFVMFSISTPVSWAISIDLRDFIKRLFRSVFKRKAAINP